MSRSVLDPSQIHPAIRERVASYQASLLQEVQASLREHAVVVIGMAQNPFPRKARRALDAVGALPPVPRQLRFSDWRRRWP